MLYRSHNCGELRKIDIGKKVVLSGWINKIRNLGNILFVDIRDFFGITQLVISNTIIEKKKLGKEFLINVKGKVVERYSKNYKLHTGEIEINVKNIVILNKSVKLPFIIDDNTDGTEEERMKYRYLDIRRNFIKNNLISRHNIVRDIRFFFYKKKFLEIETPILINYTPEGARNFLVPSRKNKGKFYSLPQSPQIFKQLLMIGGIDKYFQIVKCFRDEDSRSDRQVEFTQIDYEMSFVKSSNVVNFSEEFIKYLLKKTINKYNIMPFISISYSQSMEMYGTTNPDIRFGMIFTKLNKLKTNFFKRTELVIGIKKNLISFNKKKINYILKNLKKNNNTNILWIQYTINKSFLSSIEVKENNLLNIICKNFSNISPGDIIFISYGEKKESRNILNKIRLRIIKIIEKKKSNILQPVWVKEFPILEWDKKNNKFKSVHHPFTNPKKEDINLLQDNPEKVRSDSYDLVINGIEVASGSIRINNNNIQKIIFKYLGLSNKEIESKFGFFIKAFKYGTPPHGGIAFGLDRLINLLICNKNNIKDYIAFPKNNFGKDLMTNSPNYL